MWFCEKEMEGDRVSEDRGRVFEVVLVGEQEKAGFAKDRGGIHFFRRELEGFGDREVASD